MEAADLAMSHNSPREALELTGAFADRCGATSELTTLRYTAHEHIGDLTAALADVNALVDGAPKSTTYRFWRGHTLEQLRRPREAANDYQRILELEPSSREAAVRLSRVLARFERPCNAMHTLDALASRSPRLEPVLRADRQRFSHSGQCEPALSGTARIQGAADGHQFACTAELDGRSGEFIVDTGATYVSVSDVFARRVGIRRDGGMRITLDTAGGTRSATLVLVATLRLQGVVARQVEVAILDDDPFGGHDGVIGMNFLSRFQVHLDGAHNVLKLSDGTGQVGRGDAPIREPSLEQLLLALE